MTKVSSDNSDSDLIKAIGEGNHQAFECLVKRYKNSLFNFTYRYLGDRPSAEDLTQEVFLRIYCSAQKFEARTGAMASSWIFKIAYNLSMNEIKQRRRYTRLYDDIYNKNQESAGQPVLGPLEKQELKDNIMSELRRLPENQRAALLLRTSEGFSYREISEILGVSISSVESLIFRARKHLKRCLKRKGKE